MQWKKFIKEIHVLSISSCWDGFLYLYGTDTKQNNPLAHQKKKSVWAAVTTILMGDCKCLCPILKGIRVSKL